MFKAAKDGTKADALKSLRVEQVPVKKVNYGDEWVLASGAADAPKDATEAVDASPRKGEERTQVVRVFDLRGAKEELRKVPEGQFTTGSDKAKDKRAGDDETPAHAVTFTKDLWVAKYPVTGGSSQRM